LTFFFSRSEDDGPGETGGEGIEKTTNGARPPVCHRADDLGPSLCSPFRASTLLL